MRKEPLITVATITALASAVLSALVAFGINLTEAQSTSILGLVAVAAPLAVAWFARGKVASPSTVEKLQAEQPANAE